MGFGGITIDDLNNYMMNYPSRRIVANEITDAPLLEALKKNIDTESFRGDNIEILIKTKQPFTGKAHYEDADIPYPKDTAFVKQLIPLREVIVNAGLTRQAMMRATGGAASWGRIVDDVLRDQQVDFKWLLNLACMGNGTGALARVGANADGAVAVVPSEADTVVIYCDNTYTDFGWENVALMKAGMSVDLWDTSGGAYVTGGKGLEVISVGFKSRSNGAFAAPAAGTSCFTVQCASEAAATALAAAIQDNDVVYLYDSKDNLPMGLAGIVQDGTLYGSIQALTDFQGLTRSKYSSLRARTYAAASSGSAIGFGAASDNPAYGTPCKWGLSVISDAIADVARGGGRGKTDMLLCSSALAMAIQRKSATESNITVNVSTTGKMNQPASGSQYANKFICPDGRIIPIVVAETIPENVLYGLCLDDWNWFPFGDFDFVREYGEIWEPSRGDRKTNVEAPYGGFYNVGVNRCDNQFRIIDLTTA